MKYELNVDMKAYNHNKAMEHRFVGIFDSNPAEFKIAKLYMEWAKLYPKPNLPK